MVQLIIGNKGDGKTKHLLDRVNSQIKTASGNIVYLDKSTKHMHELNNKVRLINVTDYPLKNSDEFIGFLCGIISQDYGAGISGQLFEDCASGAWGSDGRPDTAQPDQRAVQGGFLHQYFRGREGTSGFCKGAGSHFLLKYGT